MTALEPAWVTSPGFRYRWATGTGDFEQVLEAAQRGEEWAAAIIFDAHHARLLRYLRWQEPSAADDLAGETWLAVAERIHDFTGGEDAFRAWVFSVARRRVAEYRRRGARRRTHPVAPEDLAEIAGGLDPSGLVVDVMSAQQAIDRLAAVLSPDQREVIVLRVVTGLSVEEIARVVGKRPGTVRVIQHRALRRLAQMSLPQAPARQGG